jgi:hypothetical protein
MRRSGVRFISPAPLPHPTGGPVINLVPLWGLLCVSPPIAGAHARGQHPCARNNRPCARGQSPGRDRGTRVDRTVFAMPAARVRNGRILRQCPSVWHPWRSRGSPSGTLCEHREYIHTSNLQQAHATAFQTQRPCDSFCYSRRVERQPIEWPVSYQSNYNIC